MGSCLSLQFSCDYILNGCLDFTVRRATYVCELKHNLVKLDAAKENLLVEKSDVLLKVNFEEQGEQTRRFHKVEQWLQHVHDAEIEVDALLSERSEEEQRLCAGGCWSKSCISSYRYGKRVAKQLRVVESLRAKGAGFTKVVARLPEDPVDRRLVDNEFLGRQPLIDKIQSCLNGKEVGIIGLFGMGGVGKTTLIEHINNTFCDNIHDFDCVIWVTVKDLQLEKIQENIAKRIGLYNDSWKEIGNMEERRGRISKSLRKKKFMLFFDDIREQFDFRDVGVPLPEKGKAISRIVFTTRKEDNCTKMGAHQHFRVDCLTDKEAWELFQSHVGKSNLTRYPQIRASAEIVARECDGLPLALKVVGRAMSCKTSPEEWEHAKTVLQRAAHEFEDLEQQVLSQLKISYDSLYGKTFKSCFLYCCLFSEDYKISRRDLVDYWVGEGLLKDERGAKNEGSHIINVLLRACLLEHVDAAHVKLHDVIRDMALWIASEINQQERFFVLANAKLNEAPATKKWQGAKKISLMGNHIENLSETPMCDDLLTLFLNMNCLREISGGFFGSMSSLNVLNLSNNFCLAVLPKEIAELVSLEHLDLSWTNIEELSKDLKALKELKCLNLENTSQLHTIPRELISNFTKLRVLRMLNCGSSQAMEGSLLSDNGSFLITELLCLKKLEMLSVNLTSSEALQSFFGSRELQKSTQSLSLRFLRHRKVPKVSAVDLGSLDSLNISECRHMEELKIEYSGQQAPSGFYSLQAVSISSCLKLKDLTWLIFALNLKRLVVTNCSEMEEIINDGKLGEFSVGNRKPFHILESLELRQLPKLLRIHKHALPFLELNEMIIDGCLKLQRLPLDSNSVKERKLVIQGQRNWWNKLMWEDQATKDAFRSCFKNLT